MQLSKNRVKRPKSKGYGYTAGIYEKYNDRVHKTNMVAENPLESTTVTYTSLLLINLNVQQRMSNSIHL